MIRSRRAPKFGPFIGTGVLAGFLLGSYVAFARDDAPGYTPGTAAAFLGLAGACLFGLLAAVVAVVIDRRR